MQEECPLRQSNRRALTAKHHRNPNLVKIHRNTAYRWNTGGLPAIDLKRPKQVLGCKPAPFLAARKTKSKRPCKPGQIYCMRCRTPRDPARVVGEYPCADQRSREPRGSLRDVRWRHLSAREYHRACASPREFGDHVSAGNATHITLSTRSAWEIRPGLHRKCLKSRVAAIR